MAEVQQTEQRILPAPYIEALGKTYGEKLTELTGRPIDTSKFAPQVAPESALTSAAYQLAPGLGSYAPFLGQAASIAGSPTAYQQYMSPYQQDVINATLAQFDVQAKKGLPGLAAQAIGAGAFGGAREGIQRAEYQTQSDLNRALLQAQLQQQGFGQAQALAQQALSNQLSLSQAFPGMVSSQISGLLSLGQQQQAQAQSQLEAQRQAEYTAAFEPYQRLGVFGTGVQQLISGYPGKDVVGTVVSPSPSPLQTALGAAAGLAGLYRLGGFGK